MKDFALRAALMLAVVVVPGCTDDDAVVVKGGPQAARAESERLEHADDGSYDDVAVASALVRGGEFVAPVLSTADAASLSMFDYLYRNWGLAGLETARDLAGDRIEQAILADDERYLMRLVRPTEAPPKNLASAGATTRVLARALHCDQSALSADDLAELRSLVVVGGYDTTHAALAIGWMGELGCAVPTDIRPAVVSSMAAELAAASGSDVSDLSVEQSAMLVYLGAANLLPHGWADQVIAAQRDDGGWGERGSPSNWHMTLLAMWTVAGAKGGGRGASVVNVAGQR